MYQVILYLFFAAALCLDFGTPSLYSLPKVERETLLRMPEFIWNVYGSFNIPAFLALIFMGAVCFIYKRKIVRNNSDNIWGGNKRIDIPIFLFSVFLSSNALLAKGFCINDTVSVLFETYGQTIKSLIFLIGITAGIYTAIEALYRWRYHWVNPERAEGFISCYRKDFCRIFWVYAVFLLLSYPGTLSVDMRGQLEEFFGETGWSAHHPPVSTFLTGCVVMLGSFVNGNFGLFLNGVLQSVVLAAVLAYMFQLMRELAAPRWLYLPTWFCVVTSPYFLGYINEGLKDNMYTYGFLLFEIELVQLLYKGENFLKGKQFMLFALSVFMVLTLRNNGNYAMLPTLVLLAAYFLKKKKIQSVSGFSVFAIKLFIPIACAVIAVVAMMNLFDIPKESISVRDGMSFPLQQTARFVKFHGDEVTEEEKDVLMDLFDFDKLEDIGKAYNPRVSDPIKGKFVYSPTAEDLSNYFAVWAKQGLRHPETYIAASMNQNYYLFYPFVPNNIASVGTDGLGGIKNAGRDRGYESFAISDKKFYNIEATSFVRKVIFVMYQAYFFCPGIGFLAHPATYAIILLALLLFALKDIKAKKSMIWGWGVSAVPMFMSLIVVVLAPAIQRHPRYAFPIIYCMPVVIAFYCYEMREKMKIDSGCR